MKTASLTRNIRIVPMVDESCRRSDIVTIRPAKLKEQPNVWSVIREEGSTIKIKDFSSDVKARSYARKLRAKLDQC